MRWLKSDRWKAGVTITGMLLLLVLMVWVPVSAAGAQERASGLTTPVAGTVQATPTEDATMTALEKEKLAQEIDQLKNQNYWAWTTIGPILVGFAGLLAALYSFITWIRNRQDEQKKRDEEQKRWLEDRQAERERRDEEQQRWLKDQEAEREKRAEERFQAVVEGLSSEREEAKVGAAILLRTFLHPGYEQFYTQTFDLAVANLRLRRTSPPSEDPEGKSHSPEDLNTPLPLTTLRQALIAVFKQAFPLAREWTKERKDGPFTLRSLNARGIQLDKAYLSEADLERIGMPWASLRKAILWDACLCGASLWKSKLHGANLQGADLRKADLGQCKLPLANLHKALLRGATLWGADLHEADLHEADLNKAIPDDAEIPLAGLRGEKSQKAKPQEGDKIKLDKADLLLANLRKADLRGAWLQEADLLLADLREADLRETHLRGADLRGADLRGAKLQGADLSEAKLIGIKLSGAKLQEDKYTRVDVNQIKLHEVDVNQIKLHEADRDTIHWDSLREVANSIWDDCIWANRIDVGNDALLLPVDLSGANLEGASLKDATLRGVKGLTGEQLAACKAKGAIIDEDATPSPSQSPVSPPAPSQSNDVQALSTPSAQGSRPTPDTDGSSATSSKPGPES